MRGEHLRSTDMDRARISDLAHAEHPIAAPLDDDTVDRLLRRALRGTRSVLDLGCGDGTWLLRALRLDDGLRAVGVDISGEGFDRVRHEAWTAGVDAGLELHHADAQGWTHPERFDLVLSVGAAYAFGGLRATLQAAATHLAPGGSVLLGDCFWTHPPDDRELELLGAAPDDYESLTDTMASIAGAGWLPLDGHISSQPEWDAYEWSWTGTLSRWAVEHPDDPSAPAVLDAAVAHRDLWLRASRDTLGFVTVLLTRTPDLASPDGP